VTEQVIAITRCVSWALMTQKCISGQGSVPDPAGGAYSAPPDPLAVFEGPLRLLMLIKVPVSFNLVLLRVVLESP